jgi:predicted DsbA family dithiol-disulfide isomerase
MIEVFADICCPFAHASLCRLDAYRRERGLDFGMRVRPWPLELVNGSPVDPAMLGAEIEAIRAAGLEASFAGFDPTRFPATTLPALAAEIAAYRAGDEVGERFSLAVRRALWEEGRDIADPSVLAELAASVGAPRPSADDEATVRTAWEEGKARGVVGSPHFFTSSGGFFCPTLHITHEGGAYQVQFDAAGFQQLVEAAGAG